MRFVDRQDAAARLADALGHYRGQRATVLALPRGGVPLGRVLADALQADRTWCWCASSARRATPSSRWAPWPKTAGPIWRPTPSPLPAAPAERVRAEELERIRQRRALYAGPCGGTLCGRPRGHRGGRRAGHRGHHDRRAARRARSAGAAGMRGAGGSADGLQEVQAYADEVVCLYAPAGFQAVGHHYLSFPQVSDEEVVDCTAGRA